MKKSILFFLLIGMTLLNSCETQEIVLTEQNNSNPIYNSVISNYLTNFKTSISNNKENTKKISALMQAIDYSSIKQYDLKNTIKLVVVDLKDFGSFNEVDQTKAIFLVLNNSIIRSNIVTFKNKVPFDDVNKVIVSIFDRKENKDNYFGKINFYNMFQNILLSDEFENGKLTVNGIALRDPKSSLTGKSNGCIAWYWITTYASGRQTAEYMFTTCDCEENTYRTECGGGGGSDSSTNNIPGRPNYPSNPKDKNVFTYIDWDGEIVTKQFNEEIGQWELKGISLSEVTIRSNPKKYSFLLFAWPQDLQKILNNNMIYTYEGASGSWEGEPATDETIAQAIEDQIDDSKLDPCTKGVLDKLKNLKQNDIAKIFEKLGNNSTIYKLTYEIKANNGNPASTIQNGLNNYKTTIDSDFLYGIDGTGINKPPTDLAIAAVMIHEMVHTYFFSLFDDKVNSGIPTALDNFDLLYQKYVNKNYSGTDDAQHAQIWKSFINIMASSLQEYHTGVPNDTPSQFYQDIILGTLSTTDTFDQKYPKGTDEYRRIINIYRTEKNNGSNDPNYVPKGKPCK